MAMMDYEKSKFRFSETFNNSTGKTSGSGFIGVMMGLIAVIGFLAGTFGWFFGLEGVMEYLDYVLQIGLLSAVLMGVRKASGIFGKANGNGAAVVAKPKPELDPEPEPAVDVNIEEERG